MRSALRLLMVTSCVATMLVSIFALPAVAQSADQQVFPETGHTVQGVFLDYWKGHGGLAQQGYPLSEEIQEQSSIDGKTYTEQYFERAVFELHPENPAPSNILLQLLGVLTYHQRYSSPDGAPGQNANTQSGAVRFTATGKIVGGKFLDYWTKNGGLAQYGYPISDEFPERSTVDGRTYTVQYFERAVFELHPENGPPYDVLLSQLGTFRWQERQKSPLPSPTPTLPPPEPEFRTDIPDGQYIPLYPGAVVKRIRESVADTGFAATMRFVQYDTRTDRQDLLNYYVWTLPRFGWTSAFSYNRYNSRTYHWADPSGKIPWHMQLTVDVSGGETGLIDVDLTYWRYPDASKVPLPPTAQQVEISPGSVENGSYCTNTSNTTYLTDTTPEEVEQFYRQSLPSHGWNLTTASEKIETPQGLRFIATYDTSAHTYVVLNLTIRTEGSHPGPTGIVVGLETCKYTSYPDFNLEPTP